MAFDPTTEELWLEIRAAMQLTAKHVDPAMDILRRLTGRFYTQDNASLEADPENFGYAFVSNMLPQLGIDNPVVKVKASRVVGHQTVAQAVRDGLQAWLGDVDYQDLIAPVLVDFLVARGVLLHYLEEDGRFSRGVVTPAVRRVAPERFFIDALADDPGTDAFRGHWYWADIEDLLSDEELLPEAREALVPQDEGEASITGAKPAFPKASAGELARKRVRVFSVWVRDTGELRVLVEASKIVELYDRRPYYGPPDGPYELFDCYPVPGQAWPLSPLAAVEDQSIDLNIHARAMGRAAARRKSMVLVEANNPDLGDKLANAEDGAIMPVKGITGNHVEIEIGGVTQEQYTYTEYVRDRLDRISGLTATVQGSVGDADTATEAQIAQNALTNRIGYIRHRGRKAQTGSIDRVGWYLFHTEGIVIPVNRRDPYSGQLFEGLFFGGPFPTDLGATWDDFALEITVHGPAQEAEDRAKTVEFFQLFMEFIAVAPSMPWLRTMSILRDLAAPYGMENKVDEWVIPELFGAFGQPPQLPPSLAMGTQATPPQRGGFALRPRGGRPGMLGRPDPSSGPQGSATGQAIGPRPQQNTQTANSRGYGG